MNRRDFLATGVTGVAVAAWSTSQAMAESQSVLAGDGLASPNETKLHVKPVLTNIIHSDVWEGSCRWKAVSPSDEAKNANEHFERWSKQLREKGLGHSGENKLLEPVHITFCEDFTIKQGEFDKLAPDSQSTDVFYVVPSGSSISAFEIGDRFGKPILLKGLGCRNVDIAAYTRSKGNEALVAADDAELDKLLSLLRARKIFRNTKVLFPTDKGLPAACSIGSIWDIDGLKERLGIAVEAISYKEMSEEMKTVQSQRLPVKLKSR